MPEGGRAFLTRFLHNALIIVSGAGFLLATLTGYHIIAMICFVTGAAAYIHKEEQ